MYSEKTNLIEKKGSPFYGSYKESNNVLDEIHWQNKKKKRQLVIVTTVVLILTLLAIGITLAITLPPLLERNANRTLDPPNPLNLSINSTSVLEHYGSAGVSAEDQICANIGRRILESMNGSAVDAAIGVALCHGVVSPQSCGLGGGMFMTIYSERTMYALNARETAPETIDAQDFTDNPSASSKSGLAVGIPGEISGLWMAHQKFGVAPWADLVKLATDIARNGFIVSSHLSKSLKKHAKILLADPVLRSEFINPASGEPWLEGDLLVRPRLGRTLQSLETVGAEGFYNGTLATQILEEVAMQGGILTSNDLSNYNGEWVDPIVVKYKNNLTMFSLPFPSSGPVVALGLGIMDGFGKLPPEPTHVENGIDHHRFIEALKFVEAHRAMISDPNFDTDDRLSNLLEDVISAEYADELREKIKDYSTGADIEYYGALYASREDPGTAHISIIGSKGDAVALTTTINTPFGAGFMGNVTGIIYNNEINDFSFPNKSDLQGLPSNPYNYVEPGKQPASSMAPLIFLNENGQPVLSTGSSGGFSIVPSLLAATWGSLYRNLDIKDAIDYPRFIVKFNSTVEVSYEYGLPAYLIKDLERKGQRTKRLSLEKYIGNVNSVCMAKQTQEILSNADYRKSGGSAGF